MRRPRPPLEVDPSIVSTVFLAGVRPYSGKEVAWTILGEFGAGRHAPGRLLYQGNVASSFRPVLLQYLGHRKERAISTVLRMSGLVNADGRPYFLAGHQAGFLAEMLMVTWTELVKEVKRQTGSAHLYPVLPGLATALWTGVAYGSGDYPFYIWNNGRDPSPWVGYSMSKRGRICPHIRFAAKEGVYLTL